jgi:pimeloyl-ACP methyl ester carboxylesterase
VAIVSWVALKPLVISAAGLLALLSALGGLLSRYVPWLRAPLDIALDVDNHFREFPRKAIARARIFSRYAALLEHLAAEKYQRVVIVAHSQGTVISAELLRYLQHRGAAVAPGTDATDRAANLWRFLDKKVHLLTAGCPLRQLYAARFPDRYDWVLDQRNGRVGPAAGDVGACRWINAYTTGVFGGRWLGSDTPPAAGVPLPSVDTLTGRPDLYAASTAPQALAAVVAGATELDVCLGGGAHTHYFEPDQKVVAQLVDALVST